MTDIHWVVLYGGVSSEREISLISGKAVVDALAAHRQVRAVDLRERSLPKNLDPAKHLIFPVFHGEFGEDGEVQSLLEEQGFIFAGCNAQSSALCMHKQRTKVAVAHYGIPVPQGMDFNWQNPPPTDQILTWAGQEWILKPIDQGSSVGLMCGQGPQQLAEALAHPRSGKWLCEQRIHGKDLTVGVLHGKAMGAVQIEPDGGIYDFHHKYTAGKTKYLAPAPLPDPVYAAAQSFAETAFKACGCRDFARIDFLIDEKGFLTFLEINTIPGLTPTSLLPKSAACVGMNFSDLLLHMIAPAEHRFNSRLSLHI